MSDKHSVIFEFGHRYTKCGFVHEFSPRAIIKTAFLNLSSSKFCFLFEMTSDEKLYQKLKNFIQTIYFRYLGVNAKERKVIIIESIFLKTSIREFLINLFFNHFEVPSLLIVPQHLMALVPSVISSGLVLDIGHNEAIVVPVVEGVTILSSVKYAPLGGKAINKRILEELIERKAIIFENGQSKLFDCSVNLEEDILENLKIKTCFVAPFERGQELAALKSKVSKENLTQFPPDVNFHIDGERTLTIPGSLRESVAEVLFEICGEEYTVATLILEALLDCPIDVRKLLASNIIITGGTCMLPGFKHRLKCELLELVAQETRYKEKIFVEKFLFHPPLCKENYISWLGASIFGSNDAMLLLATQRENFLKSKTSPFLDWSQYWPKSLK